MKNIRRYVGLFLVGLLALPLGLYAEDIDVFTGGTVTGARPSILIVLDNTSNWARQNQQWPGGVQQGQSEVDAIKKLIADEALVKDVNMGVVEFVTTGNAGNIGGFVRFPILPMDSQANRDKLTEEMQQAYDNINAPTEKRNSNTEYGTLLYDVYNYLSGGSPTDNLNPPNESADERGYNPAFTKFKSPITADNSCGRIYMIFIGNPNASGPATDSVANKAAMAALGCKTDDIALPLISEQTLTGKTLLAEGLHASASECQTAASATYGSDYSGYVCELKTAASNEYSLGTSSCGQYASADLCKTGSATAFPGYASYSCTETGSCAGSGVEYTLGISSCGQYGSVAACQSALETQYGTNYTGYTCTVANNCPASSNQATFCAGAGAAYDSDSAQCASKASLLPAATYSSYTCSRSNTNCSGGKIWTITGNIAAGTSYTMKGTSTGASTPTFTIKGFKDTYDIYGTYTVTLTTATGNYSSGTNMFMADEWARCLRETDVSPDGGSATAEVFRADFSGSTVAGAGTVSFSVGGVPQGVATLIGGETPVQIAQKVAAAPYLDWYATADGVNPWVMFGKKQPGAVTPDISVSDFTVTATGTALAVSYAAADGGVQGANATGGAVGKQYVTTYSIDVFNAQPNATHTALMMSMADQGGGRYFQAKNGDQILKALKSILAEIQSVNTAFAAASIPLSTTNRSQNLNEVYIGVFRPALLPRWFGNLKKFSIATTSAGADLVGQGNVTALNSQTGFLNDAVSSAWTTINSSWPDSAKAYWSGVRNGVGSTVFNDNTLLDPPPQTPVGARQTGVSEWADIPDGQFVEKGAVAQMIRRGNGGSPEWEWNRKLYTVSGTSLATLAEAHLTGSTGCLTPMFNYVRGVDTDDIASGCHQREKSPVVAGVANPVRPSVHGDVVHSRPLAINYGANDTVIYYGANDGVLRAVDGATGNEKWGFIPPEFLTADDTSGQGRLMKNNVPVKFGKDPAEGSKPKPYMYDGSAGVFQSLRDGNGDMKVWIFPTQRRGGRMLYGLDVSNSNSPTLLWANGCRESGCVSATGSDDFSGIGQTWSIPVVTKIKDGSDVKTVVIVGGGYDTCEDSPTPSVSGGTVTWSACGSGAKGRLIYVIEAANGRLLRTFTFDGMRSITAGVSVIDINSDGLSDYAYAVDLGGAVYRISFVDKWDTLVPQAAGAWTIAKVAAATTGRKLMFTPALAYGGKGQVYVAFGSGDRERPLETDYPYVNDVRNHIYAYRDNLTDLAPALCDLDGNTCTYDYSSGATCESPKISEGDVRAWRVRMAYRGEQTVTQALIVSGLVTLNTTRPVTETDACRAALGEGGGYFLNLTNGSGAIGTPDGCGGETRGFFTGVGLPTDPVLVNLPGQDPVCIGCVSRQPANPTVGSKLFEPSPLRPTITKTKSRKYQYQLID